MRIAASFERIAAVSADSANTMRNAYFTGPRVRGSIQAASFPNTPRRFAVDVVVMIPIRVTSGRHRSCAAFVTSSEPAAPVTIATTTPAIPPTAGAHTLRHARAITSVTLIASEAAIIGSTVAEIARQGRSGCAVRTVETQVLR